MSSLTDLTVGEHHGNMPVGDHSESGHSAETLPQCLTTTAIHSSIHSFNQENSDSLKVFVGTNVISTTVEEYNKIMQKSNPFLPFGKCCAQKSNLFVST